MGMRVGVVFLGVDHGDGRHVHHVFGGCSAPDAAIFAGATCGPRILSSYDERRAHTPLTTSEANG